MEENKASLYTLYLGQDNGGIFHICYLKSKCSGNPLKPNTTSLVDVFYDTEVNKVDNAKNLLPLMTYLMNINYPLKSDRVTKSELLSIWEDIRKNLNQAPEYAPSSR